MAGRTTPGRTRHDPAWLALQYGRDQVGMEFPAGVTGNRVKPKCDVIDFHQRGEATRDIVNVREERCGHGCAVVPLNAISVACPTSPTEHVTLNPTKPSRFSLATVTGFDLSHSASPTSGP